MGGTESLETQPSPVKKQPLSPLDINQMPPQSPAKNIPIINEIKFNDELEKVTVNNMNTSINSDSIESGIEDDVSSSSSLELEFQKFLPIVRLERFSKKQILTLTKGPNRGKNLRDFIKKQRYERRNMIGKERIKRKYEEIEETKFKAIQEFLEYRPSEALKLYHKEVHFFRPKRQRFADIRRSSVDFSETSSICSEIDRPRRMLITPERFDTIIYENKTTRAPKKSTKPLDPNVTYTVEAIRDINLVNANVYFRVKWENYTERDNTWEPFDNVRECEECLNEYLDKQFEDFKENPEAMMNEFYEEHKDEIENYLKKPKSVIMKECNEHNCDSMLFRCYKLVYLLIKNQIGYYNMFRRKFLKYFIFDHMLKLEEAQKNAHEVIRKEIMAKENNSFMLKIENNVDFSIFESFNYVRENVFPNDLTTLKNSFEKGCQCEMGCSRETDCCPKNARGNFAYKDYANNQIRLRLRDTQMIYECNELCVCDENCINRVTQRPRVFPLIIFKTNNGRGWGLKAASSIPRGSYIIEYTGEVIDQEESIRRGEKYDEIGKSYLFDLDFNENTDAVYTIDAAHYGNLSRLINHSCEPNCRIWPVTTCNQGASIYKLCYFTTRLIKAGEELTIDYSGGTIIQDDASENGDDKLEDSEVADNSVNGGNNIAHKHRTLGVCRCGSKFCKGYMFV